MAVNSETEINLKTLQRVDSNIVEIIDNASQVAIYKYERKLNKWEGTDIEGTLFLYRRSLYPFHGFIIVNRMNTTNFIEPITSDMEFLLQEPYFLYKKTCGDIIGSWFYEDRDFRRITNRIQRIVLKQTSPPRRQRRSSDSDSRLQKDKTVQDIMTLLSQATTDYIKTKTDDIITENEINYNKLSTYTDKKINNKSINASKEKLKSPCLRSSSEEKYSASPRRRFLSADSYNSSNSSHSSNKLLNKLIINSPKMNFSLNEVPNDEICPPAVDAFIFTSKNEKNLSAPVKLSPFFKEGLSLKTTSTNYLETTLESSETPLKLNCAPNIIDNEIGNDYIAEMTNMDKKIDNELQSSVLKQTLLSHLQVDSDIMLKIHEAYVASLKSVFTLKN